MQNLFCHIIWHIHKRGNCARAKVIGSFLEFCLSHPSLVVETLSRVWLFVTPWTIATQASLSFTSQCPLSWTHVHWVSDAIQPSHPLSSPSLPALYLFQHQGLFQCVSLHIRWPKHWSFSFSPSSEYSGLISFRIDWFDLLAVQGTLKSLLKHHNSKASILRLSTFFMVQHSHLYLTTGKTIAVTLRTFPYSQSDVSAF